jgi:ubiquinone/menaquinone biosynthesis C-methylase UbiE
MIDEYDHITATHYRAYRPPIHEIILKRCIDQKRNFTLGLDIGCGTGHSSVALLNFSEHVIGIDPSADMLENAIVNAAIEYQNFDGKTLKFDKDRFDIVTFAGSLHYSKSQDLLDEAVRVSKTPGLIVVYDFEILLDDILDRFQFESQSQNTYDHAADFSGLRDSKISIINKGKEKEQLSVTIGDLAHLLLSVKEQHIFFEKRFGPNELHRKLSDHLAEITDSMSFKIEADLYFKCYEISRK